MFFFFFDGAGIEPGASGTLDKHPLTVMAKDYITQHPLYTQPLALYPLAACALQSHSESRPALPSILCYQARLCD